MELKPKVMKATKNTYKLLIVPYGIETFLFGNTQSFDALLIVPYGIETESWVKG